MNEKEEFLINQKKHIQQARSLASDKIAFGAQSSGYDSELYGDSTADKYAGLSRYAEDGDQDMADVSGPSGLKSSWSAPKDLLNEMPRGYGDDSLDDPMAQKRTIAQREGNYQNQRLLRVLSPDRADAFSRSKDAESRSYTEVMRENQVEKDRQEFKHKLREREREERELEKEQNANALPVVAAAVVPAPRKKRRWDVDEPQPEAQPAAPTPVVAKSSSWEEHDEVASVKPRSRWDVTPQHSSTDDIEKKKRNRWDETPVGMVGSQTPVGHGSWAATPKVSSGAEAGETPRVSRSRWDETPIVSSGESSSVMGTPHSMKSDSDMSSNADFGAQFVDPRWAKEYEYRNRPLTDEELDSLLPAVGYKLLPPPATYKPIMTPSRKLMATPASLASGASEDGFYMSEASGRLHSDIPADIPASENLPLFKPEDVQFFGKLLDQKGEDDMSLEEAKERKIMRLLLRIKNGTPPLRKQSLKEIAERARYFGAGPLFNQILPLLMSPSLEDQERHLLVKVIDRILYKLDDLVRPYVHKILVVIEPLLIDEDYYARVEGREIISNLSKAAGLATMIATMRPDIDHVDEYVRNTTSRAFSVVASALGIPALLPFLKAVCKSKKSWQARHTGIKIVQQIAILVGCAILPHLKHLVEAIAHGLSDEQQKVRTISALAIASLGEAAAPYGIESFDIVLRPLWDGIQKHRGKGLAAFIKAIGSIIPLMDSEYAAWYTTRIMTVLVREFSSPDEEMKKIVLKVIRQCAATEGVTADYVKKEILPEFFRNFWIRRMALDKRNYKQVVETTYGLAQKVGGAFIIEHIQKGLKDESEPYRKMVLQAIHVIVVSIGSADITERQMELLMDGMLTTFQEQSVEDTQVLDGIGAVMKSFGARCKPFLPNICSTILWRLNNKSASVRQQSAELIARIASVMQECGEEQLLSHMGVVLYEYLGEEYPEVLGSILAGLKGIISVIGMSNMNPPIKDLLPRLTPILKNRHEKVQEHSIDLVGRIADRGAEFVSAREWMRICFELVETLKAHRKSIRRAAINTFGYIAKAIGPQDVLSTLLNNLKVQERQNRVCTTIAIAIVAETCAPFTVLPALMNEYRVPEMNVQNGVLKSLAFMFEYIGEMAKDYVYAVTPLLEDALMDRDVVHRQTACTAVKHLAVDCFGLNCEDAMLHLLNYVWPNVFEISPHMANAFTEAMEGLRLAVGPGVLLFYILQGLFHPARKVREAYWKMYNTMYIASQHALVPFYPRVQNDETNTNLGKKRIKSPVPACLMVPMIKRDNTHCFTQTTVKIRMHLAPVFVGNTEKGIRTKLNRFLLKYVWGGYHDDDDDVTYHQRRYHESVKGVVISYSDIRTLQKCGRIINDCPFVHFTIAASLASFSPVVGDVLVGSVNKQSPDHIGLLVCGIFNASISRELLSEDLAWSPEHTCWVSRKTEEAVQDGSELQFVVQQLMVQNDALSIEGSLKIPKRDRELTTTPKHEKEVTTPLKRDKEATPEKKSKKDKKSQPR